LDNINKYLICIDCNKKFTNISDRVFKLYNNNNNNKDYRCRSCSSKKSWNNKTQEEKDLICTKRGKAISEFRNNRSQEEKEIRRQIQKDAWKNKSDSSKLDFKKRMSDKRQDWWSNLSDEDYELRCQTQKNWWNNLSSEEYQTMCNKIQVGTKNWYENLDSESKVSSLRQLQDGRRDYYSNLSDEEYIVERCKINSKISKGNKKYWSDISINNYSRRCLSLKNKWDSYSYNERCYRCNTFKIGWSKKSQDERELLNQNQRDRWANLSDDEKYARIKKVLKFTGHSSLHNKFESYFNESYISNDFYYKSENITKNIIQHSWDYGIYNKSTKELVLLVDLDGDYFHGDKCDYNAIQSHENTDIKRFQSVPNNIKYHIILENNWVKSFEEMIKLLFIDYDQFVEDQFKMCRLFGFPYPNYTYNDLLSSYRGLLKVDMCNKYQKRISMNSRQGDRLITYFHKSIWHCNCNNQLSPYECYQNDELLKKVIRNRIIYINKLNPNKILQGFNISNIGKRVSVFSASRAKKLIQKYLNEFDTIFDPFSGFSGRMLGCISLGKRYIGQDINEITIGESCKLLKFLSDNNIDYDVDLKVQDTLTDNNKEYDCLFTCSPYNLKEVWAKNQVDKPCDEWIDICLSKYKCKKYLFVVDKTDKYKDYIVDEIYTRSHLISSSEYVVLIEN
jgi:hypothetical protein